MTQELDRGGVFAHPYIHGQDGRDTEEPRYPPNRQ
jgi:hypothetical protein